MGSGAVMQARMKLIKDFPSRIWSLSPSLIARFHRLRHAPASRMIIFFLAATPPASRDCEEFQIWKRSLFLGSLQNATGTGQALRIVRKIPSRRI